LHRENVTVGDFSAKNLLFDISTSPPRSFFIDCDSMCLNGDFVMTPPIETPEWNVEAVSGERLATRQSDSYKLALLAVRLFTDDLTAQIVRDVGGAPRLPFALQQLAKDGLAPTPGARPEPGDWMRALDAYLASARPASPPAASQAPPAMASRTATPPAAPAPAAAPPPASPPVVTLPGQRRTLAMGLVAAGLVLLVLIVSPYLTNSGKSSAGNGSSNGGTNSSGLPTPATSPRVEPARWVAQLASVSEVDLARRDSMLQIYRRSIPSATYARSSDYASLRGGYWMIYAAGPFASGVDALRFCLAHGWRTPGQCQGRVLSHLSTDYLVTCALDSRGHQVGKCDRAV
jgi:hypothetical protein